MKILFSFIITAFAVFCLTSCGKKQADDLTTSKVADTTLETFLRDSLVPEYKKIIAIAKKENVAIVTTQSDSCQYKSNGFFTNATKRQTLETINTFVGLAEKISPYKTDTADAKRLVAWKTASFVLITPEHEAYTIRLIKEERPNPDKKVAISIDKTKRFLIDYLSVSLDTGFVFDGNWDGLISPIKGEDVAIWPAGTNHSYEFVRLTERQHREANTKYLQLLDYFTQIIRSKD